VIGFFASSPCLCGDGEIAQKFDDALIWRVVKAKWLNLWKQENILSKEG